MLSYRANGSEREWDRQRERYRVGERCCGRGYKKEMSSQRIWEIGWFYHQKKRKVLWLQGTALGNEYPGTLGSMKKLVLVSYESRKDPI
jgi:hypothetical protein